MNVQHYLSIVFISLSGLMLHFRHWVVVSEVPEPVRNIICCMPSVPLCVLMVHF
jgi:hypothetical protein